jgi:hypothetical protein
MNTTGERVFGYDEAVVRDRRLDLLIPSLARHPRLHRRARRAGRVRRGYSVRPGAARDPRAASQRLPVSTPRSGWSKVRLDRRSVYIVCLRDTTDRKLAEAAIRESVGALPHAGRKRPGSDRRARHRRRSLRRMPTTTRFASSRCRVRNCWPPDGADSVRPSKRTGTPSFGIARGYIDRALAGEAPCFEWLHRDAHGHESPAKSAWSGCRRPAAG